MSDRPTPETDAATHDLSDYGSPVLCSWGDWVDADFARKLERERDEAREKAERYRLEANSIMLQRDKAREELKHITEYGTEEINAAVELRQKLATALVERDKARERCSKLEKAMSYSSGATTLLARFLKVLNERDTLVQKLDAWEEIAEHLHHLVQHPAYGVDQAIRRMDVLEAYKHLKHGH